MTIYKFEIFSCYFFYIFIKKLTSLSNFLFLVSLIIFYEFILPTYFTKKLISLFSLPILFSYSCFSFLCFFYCFWSWFVRKRTSLIKLGSSFFMLSTKTYCFYRYSTSLSNSGYPLSDPGFVSFSVMRKSIFLCDL